MLILFYPANLIYVQSNWNGDLQKIDAYTMLTRLNSEMDSADVFYFAESSNFSFSPEDTTQKYISVLINDCFPELKIIELDKGGMHAGVFRALISNIKDNAKTKTVVVTMNLRSFGSNWINSNAENVCQELQIAYSGAPELYRKMRLVFKAYDYEEEWKRKEKFIDNISHIKLRGPLPLSYPTAMAWGNSIADNKFRDSNGVPDAAKVELACHFVKNYAFNIDTLNNPRIKDFNQIVELCREKNIKVYFNLLAEDTENADSLVGKELVMIMRKNRDLLVHYYSRQGVQVIDNLELVRHVDYRDKDWPTEHYNQRGRTAIARHVAQYLKESFPGSKNLCE